MKRLIAIAAGLICLAAAAPCQTTPWNIEVGYNFATQKKEILTSYRWVSIPKAIGRKTIDIKGLGGFDSSMIPTGGVIAATQWHVGGPLFPGNLELFVGYEQAVGVKAQPVAGFAWVVKV